MIDHDGIIEIEPDDDVGLCYIDEQDYLSIELVTTPYLEGMGDALFPELKKEGSPYNVYLHLRLTLGTDGIEKFDLDERLFFETPYSEDIAAHTLDYYERAYVVNSLVRQYATRGRNPISLAAYIREQRAMAA